MAGPFGPHRFGPAASFARLERVFFVHRLAVLDGVGLGLGVLLMLLGEVLRRGLAETARDDVSR